MTDKATDVTVLKPCPFCGGEADIHHMPDGAHVQCFDCEANSRIFDGARDGKGRDREFAHEDAFEAWNHRTASEQPASGEVRCAVCGIANRGHHIHTAPFNANYHEFATSEAPEAGRLREALEWYGEQARLARLIHSEGDAGRRALEEDGGKKARAALSPPCEGAG